MLCSSHENMFDYTVFALSCCLSVDVSCDALICRTTDIVSLLDLCFDNVVDLMYYIT